MRLWSFLLYLPFVLSHPIRSISFYGLETELKDFTCSWKHPITFYLDVLKALDFTTIRVPFSREYVLNNDFSKMDNFIQQSYIRNFTIILDYHRTYNSHQGDITEVSIKDLIDTWYKVLDRYLWYDNVIGGNCFNEPQGKDPVPIMNYMKSVFDAIESRYGDRYIHFATGTNWGGSLVGINLENEPYKDRMIYSAHKYAFSGTADRADWDSSFGTLFPAEKLCIGEWGFILPEQREWAERFIAYLREKGIEHTSYWTVANSGDTGNLVFDDCEIIKWDHYSLIKKLWYG